MPSTESIMLSERLRETRLYRVERPGGTETSRLEDKSRCVTEVRYGSGVVGMNVKELSARDRYRRKALFDGGS